MCTFGTTGFFALHLFCKLYILFSILNKINTFSNFRKVLYFSKKAIVQSINLPCIPSIVTIYWCFLMLFYICRHHCYVAFTWITNFQHYLSTSLSTDKGFWVQIKAFELHQKASRSFPQLSQWCEHFLLSLYLIFFFSFLKTSLLNLWGFHIMHPNSIYLPATPISPLIPFVFPMKERKRYSSNQKQK